jgi:flagellar motor switch protein FliN/FliY
MSSLQNRETGRPILDPWVENLVQVLESMTDQRPAASWKTATGTAADLGIALPMDLLWWQMKLGVAPDAEIRIAAPKTTWESIGTLALKAAGLEGSSPDEIKSTWLEVLAQWVSALARSLSSHLGREVTCDGGTEAASNAQHEWMLVSLKFGDTELPPVAAGFSPSLMPALTASQMPEQPESKNEELIPQSNPGDFAVPTRTLDLLLDVDLPVSISFGKTQLPLKDVLKLTTGSIVELNRNLNEPVDVLVNHCLVARGEVVVVEGNYGVRIQQIVDRQARLQSLR